MKKPVYKRKWFIIIAAIMIIGTMGIALENEEEAKEPKKEAVKEAKEAKTQEGVKEEPKELSRKDEIYQTIESKITDAKFEDMDAGEYQDVKLKELNVNDNLGLDVEGYYGVLIYLDIKNKSEYGLPNEVYYENSDDFIRSVAREGMEDITNITLFWKDERNNRSMKYSYELLEGEFQLKDKMEQ